MTKPPLISVVLRYPGDESCVDDVPVYRGRLARRRYERTKYAVVVPRPDGVRPRRVRSVIARALRSRLSELSVPELEPVRRVAFTDLVAMLEQL